MSMLHRSLHLGIAGRTHGSWGRGSQDLGYLFGAGVTRVMGSTVVLEHQHVSGVQHVLAEVHCTLRMRERFAKPVITLQRPKHQITERYTGLLTWPHACRMWRPGARALCWG